MRIHAWLLMLAAIPAGAAPSLVPAEIVQSARTITRHSLEGPIRFLASDALEGREPSTRGEVLARTYLATELQSLGYQPGAPQGEWEQAFDMVGLESNMPRQWSFTTRGKSVDLAFRDDYMGITGAQEASVAIKDAELVFVGYGIQAPEYRWDDFKGADLKGKILVMLDNDPDWDPGLFQGKRRLYYGRYFYKYESGARQGAAGVIIIHTSRSSGSPWQVVQTSWSGERYELPAEGEARIRLRAWMTENATRRLFSAAGQDVDKLIAAAKQRSFKPVPLGIRSSIQFDNRLTRVRTANVAGLLPGSDANLKNEVVIYTAHHDHLGIGKPDATGDSIYNGALDNALGCAQVLSIARAFAALSEKPRRSVLMLFVTAEEQGLLGSKYYARYPTFAPGRMAANINYDVGNKWGRTRDAVFIDLGKSSLDGVMRAVAESQGRVAKPDAFPDLGLFYRSDHFNFAQIGVPTLWVGVATDFIGRPSGWGRQQVGDYIGQRYHQPNDEFDERWNFDGLIDDAQLGFLAGWLVAQADAMPTWNKGDEFEAVREKALADLPAR